MESQRDLLGTMLSEPSLVEVFLSDVRIEDFTDETLAEIARVVLAGGADEAVDVNRVCARLADDRLTQVVIDLYHESAGRGNERMRFDAALRAIRDDKRKRDVVHVRQALADARASGDEKRELELLKQHQELMK